MRQLALVLCALALGGCAIKPIDSQYGLGDIRNNLLYINSSGNLYDPETGTDKLNFRSPEEEEKIIAAAKALNDDHEKPLDQSSIPPPTQASRLFSKGRREVKKFSKTDETCDSPGAVITSEGCEVRVSLDPLSCASFSPASPLDATEEEAYVMNILRTYCANAHRVKDITIFIHGGLNIRAKAINRASDLRDEIFNDGHYPIFVGWRSGPWANLAAHYFIDHYGQAAHRPTLTKVPEFIVVPPAIFVEDAFRAIGKAPRAAWTTFQQQRTIPTGYFFTSTEEQGYESVRANYYEGPVPRCDHGEFEDKDSNPPNPPLFTMCKRGNDAGVTVGQSLLLANPIKWVTAPLIDGFGTGMWTSMKRRADILLQREESYYGYSSQGGGNYNTALTKLLNALERLEPSPEVTLVGHSMGSIVANTIQTQNGDLNVKNVVYMGAAASVKDVANAVIPTLRRNPEARFYNLSIDPYRELLETKAWLLGTIPNGSLLNWIDLYFEQVSAFTDRTAGSWWNITRAAETVFPPDVQKQIFLTAFGYQGSSEIQQGPQNHGDFGDYKWWEQKFWEGKDIGLSQRQ